MIYNNSVNIGGGPVLHAQADLPDNLFMKAYMDCLCIDMLFNLAPTKKSDFDELQSQH